MKKTIKTTIVGLAFAICTTAFADVKTAWVYKHNFLNGEPQVPVVTIDVKEGETFRLLNYLNSARFALRVSIEGAPDGLNSSLDASFDDSNMPLDRIFAGPLAITLEAFLTLEDIGRNVWASGVAITYEINRPTITFQPSNAVVIPADSFGPVEIIMELSVDMVNWTRSEPGTYGTSTEKRFFRIRAARK